MDKKDQIALTRGARAMSGLSQIAFAEACGVSRQSIELAETVGVGPRVWPKLIAGAAGLGLAINADARFVRIMT